MSLKFRYRYRYLLVLALRASANEVFLTSCAPPAPSSYSGLAFSSFSSQTRSPSRYCPPPHLQLGYHWQNQPGFGGEIAQGCWPRCLLATLHLRRHLPRPQPCLDGLICQPRRSIFLDLDRWSAMVSEFSQAAIDKLTQSRNKLIVVRDDHLQINFSRGNKGINNHKMAIQQHQPRP